MVNLVTSLTTITTTLKLKLAFISKHSFFHRFYKMASEAKKLRKANWTQDETLLLVQAVYDRRDIIHGRYGKTVTSADKKTGLGGSDCCRE